MVTFINRFTIDLTLARWNMEIMSTVKTNPVHEAMNERCDEGYVNVTKFQPQQPHYLQHTKQFHPQQPQQSHQPPSQQYQQYSRNDNYRHYHQLQQEQQTLQPFNYSCNQDQQKFQRPNPELNWKYSHQPIFQQIQLQQYVPPVQALQGGGSRQTLQVGPPPQTLHVGGHQQNGINYLNNQYQQQSYSSKRSPPQHPHQKIVYLESDDSFNSPNLKTSSNQKFINIAKNSQNNGEVHHQPQFQLQKHKISPPSDLQNNFNHPRLSNKVVQAIPQDDLVAVTAEKDSSKVTPKPDSKVKTPRRHSSQLQRKQCDNIPPSNIENSTHKKQTNKPDPTASEIKEANGVEKKLDSSSTVLSQGKQFKKIMTKISSKLECQAQTPIVARGTCKRKCVSSTNQSHIVPTDEHLPKKKKSTTIHDGHMTAMSQMPKPQLKVSVEEKESVRLDSNNISWKNLLSRLIKNPKDFVILDKSSPGKVSKRSCLEAALDVSHRQKWTLVKTILDISPATAFCDIYYGETFKKFKDIPFFHALRLYKTGFEQTFSEAIDSFITSNEPSLYLRSKENGRSALHIAIDNPCIPYTIVCKILRINPQAASMTDNDGTLPLHSLCSTSSRPVNQEILKLLIEAFPVAVLIEDCSSKTTPTQQLINSCEIFKENAKALLILRGNYDLALENLTKIRQGQKRNINGLIGSILTTKTEASFAKVLTIDPQVLRSKNKVDVNISDHNEEEFDDELAHFKSTLQNHLSSIQSNENVEKLQIALCRIVKKRELLKVEYDKSQSDVKVKITNLEKEYTDIFKQTDTNCERRNNKHNESKLVNEKQSQEENNSKKSLTDIITMPPSCFEEELQSNDINLLKYLRIEKELDLEKIKLENESIKQETKLCNIHKDANIKILPVLDKVGKKYKFKLEKTEILFTKQFNLYKNILIKKLADNLHLKMVSFLHREKLCVCLSCSLIT